MVPGAGGLQSSLRFDESTRSIPPSMLAAQPRRPELTELVTTGLCMALQPKIAPAECIDEMRGGKAVSLYVGLVVPIRLKCRQTG